MPELAEVEFYRKEWNVGLRQKIQSVELNKGKRIFRGINVGKLKKTIEGASLIVSRAHGKQMLFSFTKGGWLGIHLGMTGKLRTEKVPFVALKHDHLVLHQKNHALVFSDPRLFGRVLFDTGPHEPVWWTKLPPSLTSSQFTLAAMKQFLIRHRKAPIKAVLLSQSGFPGIGNWMADEILWQAKLHPRTASGKIDDARRKVLYQKVRFVCREAIRIVGEDFSDLPTSWLFRYRWKKKGACPRCAAILEHATIGGRTTCWCPSCQSGV
ncbi:MAG: DNA-formamidopyrimidine glycosylase family protein [Verrucomicrobiota bacterium]